MVFDALAACCMAKHRCANPQTKLGRWVISHRGVIRFCLMWLAPKAAGTGLFTQEKIACRTAFIGFVGKN